MHLYIFVERRFDFTMPYWQPKGCYGTLTETWFIIQVSLRAIQLAMVSTGIIGLSRSVTMLQY